MPQPSGSCNCLHCNALFVPDPRNRGRQRYCRLAPCRQASKQASQRRWLAEPQNRDYFRGPENVARVRAWRQAHPGYARKEKPAPSASRESSETQAPAPQPVAPAGGLVPPPPLQDPCPPLQDLCRAQEPLLVGLVSSFIGSPLQDDIVAHLHRLVARGREILGTAVPLAPDSS